MLKSENLTKYHFPGSTVQPRLVGHIDANPELQANHSRGVIVGQFGILYEAFDDTVTSGKQLR